MSDNLSPEITCTRCGSSLHLSCGVGEQEPTDDELTIDRLKAELGEYRKALEDFDHCEFVRKLLAKYPGAK